MLRLVLLLITYTLIHLVTCLPGEAGTVPAAFVDLGYGARPLGMSGAFVAVADDPNAITWNPAGLAQISSAAGTFMHTQQKGLIPYDFIAYAQPLSFLGGTAGLGLISSGDELLKENTVALAYGRPLGKIVPLLTNFNCGATFKIRSASFGNDSDGGPDRVTGTAFGFGLDLGFLYKLNEQVSLGANLQDLVAPLNWDSSANGSYNESLPFIPVVGARYEIAQKFIFAADLNNFNEFHAGVEKGLFKVINLRFGYNHKLELDPQAEFAFGLGLKPISIGIGKFSLDFGYRSEELASSWRLSVNFSR